VSPADQTSIATFSWEDVAEPRGVVQIAHGIAEHALRYDRLARALVAAGYRVHANDHRGHGRSATSPAGLGHFGEPGFPGLIEDVAAYGRQLVDAAGGLPVFLIGHSMGSFAAQAVIQQHSELYAGAVLSGSTALDVLAQRMAEAAAAAEGGPAGLEAFNAGFEPRTGYEWLSRDETEVDLYVADPLSGFELPDDAVPALFTVAPQLADPEVLAGIRSDLPLLLVSGSDDPLAGGGQLVELLGDRYRQAGITDVTTTLYPDARHEIFNETNRDEITADVVAWLDAHS
jgi:alpha-beta hydrolase superfamily lysophospholipase